MPTSTNFLVSIFGNVLAPLSINSVNVLPSPYKLYKPLLSTLRLQRETLLRFAPSVLLILTNFDSPRHEAYREAKGNVMQTSLELEALVRAGIFASQEQGVQEAVRVLLTVRPHLRIEMAIQLYREEQVTLGRAAEIAGLSRWEFRDLLVDRGIRVEVEAAPAEEMDEEFKKLAARTGHDSR